MYLFISCWAKPLVMFNWLCCTAFIVLRKCTSHVINNLVGSPYLQHVYKAINIVPSINSEERTARTTHLLIITIVFLLTIQIKMYFWITDYSICCFFCLDCGDNYVLLYLGKKTLNLEKNCK